MAGIPLPKCKAILICERTIVEAATGQTSLIGIFDEFTLPTIPGRTEPFRLYIRLSEGIGQYRIHVEIHDLQEDQIIGRTDPAIVHWEERLATAELFISIPRLRIPHAGPYDLIVLANGEEIDRQQFTVHQDEGDDEDE